MDNAVALVQAYLYVNGYFTVTEYPVVEQTGKGHLRSATDLDVLAFRFPKGGMIVPGKGHLTKKDHVLTQVDPVLGVKPDEVDMLVGEVKEGKARFNKAMFKPSVLRAGLTRFGCCGEKEAEAVVQQLLKKGEARTQHGHRLRQAVFGLVGDLDSKRKGLRVGLDHVREYLEGYIDRNWEVFRQANFSDPGLGWLVTLKKTGLDFESGGPPDNEN